MNIRVIGNEDFLSKHVKKNKLIYMCLLVIFVLGIVFGSVYYKNLPAENELPKYMENNLKSIKETTENDTYKILTDSIIKNVSISVLFLVLGASIIGIPILIIYIGYKGFTLGFTISTLIMAYGIIKGNIISFIMLFFQNIIILPLMLFAMISSIKYARNVLTRSKDMKIELIRHTLICAFCSIGFFVASIIEVFFNSNILGRVIEKL